MHRLRLTRNQALAQAQGSMLARLAQAGGRGPALDNETKAGKVLWRMASLGKIDSLVQPPPPPPVRRHQQPSATGWRLRLLIMSIKHERFGQSNCNGLE